MDWLDDPRKIIPVVLSLLAFLTVIGLALPWLQPDIFATRLKTIARRRDALGAERRARLKRERPSLRRATPSGRVAFMRAVIAGLRLDALMTQPELRRKLVRAGKRSSQALVTFIFLRLALPLVLGGGAALALFGPSNAHLPGGLKIAIAIVGLVFGYLLPDILVSNAVAHRQQAIQRKFPDALDLMVICIESGISIESAFARVAEEMAVAAPALAEEMGIATAELAYLNDRRQAFENLAERTGSAAVKSLVTALIQSERYGTPVGTALRVVAQESRDARMAKAEEKAAALPAKLTVPMVMFFLPVLFLVLIGPTIIQVMRAFAGHG